jgi:hypothetical protein
LRRRILCGKIALVFFSCIPYFVVKTPRLVFVFRAAFFGCGSAALCSFVAKISAFKMGGAAATALPEPASPDALADKARAPEGVTGRAIKLLSWRPARLDG